MRIEDVSELHYITSIENIPSILQHGILSNRRAYGLQHASIANPSVQNLRERRMLPSGRALHEYANLYINARNPMMYYLRNGHENLCVLRVSPEVLHLPGVMVSDGNAAHNWTRFDPPSDGLKSIDEAALFAEYWTCPSDAIQEAENKRRRCAEVLVPNHVEIRFIIGAYASCDTAAQQFALTFQGRQISILEHMFFLRSGSND